MAVEEKKVLDAIELKFKGKSITKDFKKNLSKSWAPKIDNDADIDAYINDREDIVLEASAEGDRRATAATKKPVDTKKTEVKTETEIDDDELKDATPVERALLKQIKELSGKVAGFETQTTKQKLASKFEGDERLKGIDKRLFRGRYPETEEEFENAVAETAEELKDFVKADGGKGNNQQQKPVGGDRPNYSNKSGEQQQAGTASKETMENVKKFTSTLKPPTAASATN